MYPFFRFIITLLCSSLSKPINVQDGCITTFYCMPWDIDMFLEMNNGRVVTLYDLGRFAYSIRSGLTKALKQQGWGIVVAGSSVRYRLRIRVFNKVTMHTHIAGVDDRWIYVVQSMWVKGKPASSALIRAGVTEKGKTIPIDRVLQAMNITDWKAKPAGWVKAWVDAEAERPWPPEGAG